MSKLTLHLLGGMQIHSAENPLPTFISNKVPALLAYLAVNRRAHSRDKLASLLWGEMSDADSKNNLRQALTNLRKIANDNLTITRDSVELVGDVFLDSAQFEHLVNHASSLDPQPASALLTDSLRLYQGDFLEGFHVREAPAFEDWVLSERSRLRELALQALHALTQFHTTHGNFIEAIKFASRLLIFDPWREEAHRQLMLLYAKTGQMSAALSQYETCKKILEKELGVEPSLETTDLYERIRSARSSVRQNIPATTTGFIGRKDELISLRMKLANPNCRLITLTGLGGTGKTRLAQEIARQSVDTFIHGAWMIPLAAVDAEGMLATIANAMNFSFTTGDHKKQLLNFLRKKELLLVLDNFEHLLESSMLVSEILQFAPEVKILVTSRERLDIDGEWVVELPGLAIQSMEANQLFIQGARRAGSEIQFNENESNTITEICSQVGGLPLGIEIAAAWMRSMDLRAIKAEIQKSLDFLASTRRDIPERQRSLRAVFEAAWARLSESEQKTFTALSVFRGGFTREAGEQVAGNFSTLLERSLVQKSNERFELHEVTRKFAEEKLLDANTAFEKHAAYYSAWAQSQARILERDSFPSMNLEFENIRAAWAWSSTQENIENLTRIAPFTKRYLDIQGRYQEGIELFSITLQKAGSPKNASDLPQNAKGHLIARLLVYTALWIADGGNPEDAIQTLSSCLAYFRQANDEHQLMVCLNGLGNANRFLHHEEQAAIYYREELEIARRIGHHDEEGTALNNLALTINTLGNFEEAERLHRECLALRREMEDYPGISSSLINLGVVLFDQHRYEEAKPLLDEAIKISRQYNHPRNLAASLGNLGGVLMIEKKFEEALELFLQGLEIHRTTGYRFGIAIALDNVGTAHFHLGNDSEALYYLKQSIREARDIKADFIALDALVWIANLLSNRGEKKKALTWLNTIKAHPHTDPETFQNMEKLRSALLNDENLEITMTTNFEDMVNEALALQ
ncbi:MAG: tetratricopeptide repeat protein [Anaerolineales bacterium]